MFHIKILNIKKSVILCFHTENEDSWSDQYQKLTLLWKPEINRGVVSFGFPKDILDQWNQRTSLFHSCKKE